MKYVVSSLLCLAFNLSEAAAQQTVPPLKKEFLDSTFAVLPSATGAKYRRETEWRDNTAGEVREYYLSNGQLRSRQQYENIRLGMGHGVAETWTATGQLLARSEQSHGKPIGELLLYYPSGQLKARVRYLDGALDDSWCFGPNGQKMDCPAAILTLPVYSGGNGSLQAVSDAFRSNFHYPREAKRTTITGRIIVSFEVDAQGSVANARIEQGLAPVVDEEALQAVYKLKRFRPGTQGGQPIAVHYRLPLLIRPE